LLFSIPAPTLIYPLSLHDALPIFGAFKNVQVFTRACSGLCQLFLDSTVFRCKALRHPAPIPGQVFADAIELDAPTITVIAEQHRSEEHTSELQSRENLVCRLLLEK